MLYPHQQLDVPQAGLRQVFVEIRLPIGDQQDTGVSSLVDIGPPEHFQPTPAVFFLNGVLGREGQAGHPRKALKPVAQVCPGVVLAH